MSSSVVKSYSVILRVAAVCLVTLCVAPDIRAQAPGPNDVKVEWDSGFPKKEDGKLKFKGKATFANGWVSTNGAVTVAVIPVGGGVSQHKVLTLSATNTFEGDMPLTNFPAPAQNYDIVATVMAKLPPDTVAWPVGSPVVRLSLP